MWTHYNFLTPSKSFFGPQKRKKKVMLDPQTSYFWTPPKENHVHQKKRKKEKKCWTPHKRKFWNQSKKRKKLPPKVSLNILNLKTGGRSMTTNSQFEQNYFRFCDVILSILNFYEMLAK